MTKTQHLPVVPQELVDEIAKGNGALLVGAGLSVGARLPTWSDLVSPLADRIHLPPSLASNLVKVAQYYENTSGRRALIDYVCEHTDTTGVAPTCIHRRLLSLPIGTWLTTNYDDLLERTLQEAKRAFTLVVRDDDLPYATPDRITLVKFHGDRFHRDTIVITERDYQTYFHRYRRVRAKLEVLLLEKTVLTIGYSINDPDFNQILAEITYDLAEHQRRAYAVLPCVNQFTRDDLSRRNIEVVDLMVAEEEDPSDRLGQWLDDLICRTEHRSAASAPGVPHEPEALAEYLTRTVRNHEERMKQATEPQPLSERPYRGLSPFTIKDQCVFFGRDQATEDLYRHVLSDRLTVLHGKSGAGKTSLLNAGLAPRLIKNGRMPVFINSYDDPTTAIKRAIAPPSVGEWPEPLLTMPLPRFLDRVCQAFGDKGQELVLILDQFEEFFVVHPAVEQRSPFVEALAQCYHDRALCLRFVIVVRKDYFADVAGLRPCLPTVCSNAIPLLPMTRDEAKAAIVKPVAILEAGASYEDDLLEALLNDLARGGMELPHLQIICSRLYDSQLKEGSLDRPVVITREIYESLGAAAGILGGYLNGVLGELDEVDLAVAKPLLVAFAGSGPTRKVLTESSLIGRVRAERRLLDRVLAHLVGARLLQRSRSEDEIRYQLAHEFLSDEIRTWLGEEDLARIHLEEMLKGEVASWRVYGAPIPDTKLEILYAQRSRLAGLDDESARCVLESVLAAGQQVDDWTSVAGWLPDAQRTLADLAIDVSASVSLRAAAADALDRIGGSRPGVNVTQEGLPDIAWCPVPGGTFIMGEGESKQRVKIDEPYQISKYPITNAQFEAFVQDGGYTAKYERCWIGAGPELKESRGGPQRLGGGFDLPSHPVVAMEWGEALAFCRWLAERLHREINLPTEAQWERAARGTDERCFPWGNEITPEHANYRLSNLRCTTAVGVFPQGTSPCGAMDMSGNAWEWCRSVSGARGVLRGGSYDRDEDYLHCAYSMSYPLFGGSLIGFRVVTTVGNQEV